MTDLYRLRRAGGEALRLVVDLLPDEWDPRSGDQDVCILFVDVEGYSAFVAETGDDAGMAALDVLEERTGSALAGHRGARVVKRLGDGRMISSRGSAETLRIGVTLVRGFDADMRDRAWPLRLRAGAHRGTTRRYGDDYFGYHVNLAARVAECATGGQVLTSANVLAGVDLAELGLTARPVRTLRAKGVTGPVELFLVEEAPPEPVSAAGRHEAS